MTLQRDAGGGRGFGMFGGNRRGRGGPPGGDNNNPQGGATTQPSGVQAAMTDLENTLSDQSAGADQIKTKLEALRDARTKAKQDLAQAQVDLKSVLTQRQEAVLVLRGLLD
jgi:chromosome segregation ATPase